MHHLKNSRHSRAVHLFAALLVLFALLASACTSGDIVHPDDEDFDEESEGFDDESEEFDEESEDSGEVLDEEATDEEDLELAEDDAPEELDCNEVSCDDDDLTECDGGVCDLDDPIDECDGGSCDEVVDEDSCGGQTCVAAADYDWANATCVSTVHVPSANIDSLSHLLVAIVTFGLFANAIVEWEVPGTPGTTTATLDADGSGELEVGLNSYGPYTVAAMTVNGKQVPVDGFPELVVDAAEGPIHGNC